MDTPFGIDAYVDGSTAHVVLIGEIDIAAVPAIRECAQSLLGDERIRSVVVDMSGTTFIDACGVGALIGGRRLAARNGKDCTIIGVQGRVARVLDVMGLTEYFAAKPG